MTMGFMLLAPISIYVVEAINDSYMEIPSTPGQTPATPVTRREATNYLFTAEICLYPVKSIQFKSGGDGDDLDIHRTV
jgi:hypothetical protein